MQLGYTRYWCCKNHQIKDDVGDCEGKKEALDIDATLLESRETNPAIRNVAPALEACADHESDRPENEDDDHKDGPNVEDSAQDWCYEDVAIEEHCTDFDKAEDQIL